MNKKLRKFKKKYRYFRKNCLDYTNRLIAIVKLGKNRVINNNEYRITGLMRTGNHAIINWLFSQLDEPKCFLNYIDDSKNPFIFFKRKGTLTQFPQTYFENSCLKCEALGFLKPKEALIYSFEDAYLKDVYSERFLKNIRRWVGKSEKVYNILLIRDPYNLFASRLKREEKYKNRYSLKNPRERKEVIEIWKQYAREFLGKTDLIPNPKVFINYNKWAISLDYRKDTARELGIKKYSDEAMNQILSIGGGSSFNEKAHKPPSPEEIFSRWKKYSDDELFLEIFKDKELVSLSEQIFGKI